jgi:hypothetical protein
MLLLVLLQHWTAWTWHPASFAATPAPLAAVAADAASRRDCFRAALTALQQQQVPSALLALLLLLLLCLGQMAHLRSHGQPQHHHQQQQQEEPGQSYPAPSHP